MRCNLRCVYSLNLILNFTLWKEKEGSSRIIFQRDHVGIGEITGKGVGVCESEITNLNNKP